MLGIFYDIIQKTQRVHFFFEIMPKLMRPQFAKSYSHLCKNAQSYRVVDPVNRLTFILKLLKEDDVVIHGSSFSIQIASEGRG